MILIKNLCFISLSCKLTLIIKILTYACSQKLFAMQQMTCNFSKLRNLTKGFSTGFSLYKK